VTLKAFEANSAVFAEFHHIQSDRDSVTNPNLYGLDQLVLDHNKSLTFELGSFDFVDIYVVDKDH
jgi:hypothetical protein